MAFPDQPPSAPSHVAPPLAARPAWAVPRVWPWLIGSFVVIGLVEVVRGYTLAYLGGEPQTWWHVFVSTFPFWGCLGFLLAPLVPVIHRFPLELRRWRRSLAIHLAIGLPFGVLCAVVAPLIADLLHRGYLQPPIRYFLRLFHWTAVPGFYSYAALVAILSALDSHRRYVEEERAAARLAVRASELEASLAQSRLETLRMQLNPHFLFNTLNATSVLALKGERDKVAAMLTRLSDLLRAVLESSAQVVPLADELALLERYLEIERVRFGDRLTVVVEADPAVLEAEVPGLVLQPLAENAVRHGISRQPGPGRLEVRAKAGGGRMVIEVRDSGPGFGGAEGGARGLGLANTRERLAQLYGGAAVLELLDAPGGGGLVRLELPLRAYVAGGTVGEGHHA
ncbi:MAG TPA: histidine kinase [Thermoanaerobaculia bacterium]|nr:histidine kinase [Thermoanaerobaculia bacterium]